MSEQTRLLVLGRQGSGKGTQSMKLAEALGITHVSTGDLFRREVARKSALGRKVSTYLDKGALVPDDLVIDVVMNQTADLAGWVLDGFPRTMAQGQALVDALDDSGVDLAIELDVPVHQVVGRLSLRRVCDGCGAISVAVADDDSIQLCNACGGHVGRRPDDTVEAIELRLTSLTAGKGSSTRLADALDVGHCPVTCLLGLGIETLDRGKTPDVDHQRLEDLVVMNGEIVDTGGGDRLRVRGEPRDGGAGHREVGDLARNCPHHRRGIQLDRRLRNVAIEHVMQVLVAGDPGHDLGSPSVGEHPTRVAVGDSSRQLLDRDVDEPVRRVVELRNLTGAHLMHAAPLESDGVDASGDQQVVTHDDGVTTLFCGPTLRPGAPRMIVTEGVPNGAEVMGQIVLGQQVDEQGTAHGLIHRGIVGRPVLPRLIVTTLAPRNHLMRKPFLGIEDVALQQALGHGSQFEKQVRRHPFSLPTGR
ncbi:MAG: nucleoside monophosphate kinase [Actinobacteria bacterium]|nr:nucleoside monophosphate kinase [Actinomycetota bacterium]